jgi:hypothetical protein
VFTNERCNLLVGSIVRDECLTRHSTPASCKLQMFGHLGQHSVHASFFRMTVVRARTPGEDALTTAGEDASATCVGAPPSA